MKVTFTNGQPVDADAVAGGLRLPDQRDRVRPGRPGVPVPDREASWRPSSGPSENPAPDKGPASNAPGHGRLRVTAIG